MALIEFSFPSKISLYSPSCLSSFSLFLFVIEKKNTKEHYYTHKIIKKNYPYKPNYQTRDLADVYRGEDSVLMVQIK